MTTANLIQRSLQQRSFRISDSLPRLHSTRQTDRWRLLHHSAAMMNVITEHAIWSDVADSKDHKSSILTPSFTASEIECLERWMLDCFRNHDESIPSDTDHKDGGRIRWSVNDCVWRLLAQLSVHPSCHGTQAKRLELQKAMEQQYPPEPCVEGFEMMWHDATFHYIVLLREMKLRLLTFHWGSLKEDWTSKILKPATPPAMDGKTRAKHPYRVPIQTPKLDTALDTTTKTKWGQFLHTQCTLDDLNLLCCLFVTRHTRNLDFRYDELVAVASRLLYVSRFQEWYRQYGIRYEHGFPEEKKSGAFDKSVQRFETWIKSDSVAGVSGSSYNEYLYVLLDIFSPAMQLSLCKHLHRPDRFPPTEYSRFTATVMYLTLEPWCSRVLATELMTIIDKTHVELLKDPSTDEYDSFHLYLFDYYFASLKSKYRFIKRFTRINESALDDPCSLVHGVSDLPNASSDQSKETEYPIIVCLHGEFEVSCPVVAETRPEPIRIPVPNWRHALVLWCWIIMRQFKGRLPDGTPLHRLVERFYIPPPKPIIPIPPPPPTVATSPLPPVSDHVDHKHSKPTTTITTHYPSLSRSPSAKSLPLTAWARGVQKQRERRVRRRRLHRSRSRSRSRSPPKPKQTQKRRDRSLSPVE